jgi:ABC-type nitrate/sulfonate/bicarbonate transport system substrate-binding protein
MTNSLRIGYVPLTDAALLHVAKAQHFAAARGVEIELVADSSWANIRDKLVAGHFDAAHMLAPAAIAVSLGIGQIEAPLVALGLNGNAITVSQALFEALRQEVQGEVADPRVTAKALATIVARRRESGEAPLTFGHVFPFSSHHYQLRLWLRAGHLDPDEDVKLVVVPSPFMVWTLRKGASASRGIRWPSRPALGPSSIKARISSATARKRSWLSGPNGRGRMGTTSAPSREPSTTRRAGRRHRATGTPW